MSKLGMVVLLAGALVATAAGQEKNKVVPGIASYADVRTNVVGNVNATSMWSFVLEAKHLTKEERVKYNNMATAYYGAPWCAGMPVSAVANEVKALDTSRELDELNARVEEMKAAMARAEKAPPPKLDRAHLAYAQGVSDALDAAQAMDGRTNATWAEISAEVKRKLGVGR